MIDVIIPTIPGREKSLDRLIASIERTTETPFEIIVIENSKTCGWGWRKGLEESSDAPYVLLACDDQEFIGIGWDQVAMATVDGGRLPCPRVWLPDGSIESQGGDMGSPNHVVNRYQKDWTPVDYTTIPFCSRDQIDEIGMLDVHYASDVWVSYRGRQLGVQTLLRHGFDVRHYQESVGRGAGMAQSDRDAMDCKTVFQKLDDAGLGGVDK